MTASGGVATFSGLTITTAASGYTIVATSSGVGDGVTNAMTVTPAAATQLVITQQPPSTVKVSSPFSMQASIEDAYGNVVTTDSGTRERRVRQQSDGRDTGRHADRDRVGRRGQLHQPDDQQDRLRLHAPGLQQRADLGHE